MVLALDSMGIINKLKRYYVVMECADLVAFTFATNLVPRVLSLPRESTLVAAGHVPMYTNQIPIGGGSLT